MELKVLRGLKVDLGFLSSCLKKQNERNVKKGKEEEEKEGEEEEDEGEEKEEEE